jgi:hypothetical protein
MKKWDKCAMTSNVRLLNLVPVEIPIEQVKREILEHIEKEEGHSIKEYEFEVLNAKTNFCKYVRCRYNIN